MQDPNVTVRRELQEAAREIRAQVQRELQAQGRGSNPSSDQGVVTPPVPPVPNIIVRPGTDQVIVGTGSEFPWRGGGREQIPPQAVELGMAFFFSVVAIVIGLPIARAFARRMDRKAVPPQIPAEVTAQLGQLAQAVDAIALEVERISEGQRFTTRLLSEQRDAAHQALPAGSDR